MDLLIAIVLAFMCFILFAVGCMVERCAKALEKMAEHKHQ